MKICGTRIGIRTRVASMSASGRGWLASPLARHRLTRGIVSCDGFYAPTLRMA
jgi:hypothetical protein